MSVEYIDVFLLSALKLLFHKKIKNLMQKYQYIIESQIYFL